MNADKFSKLVIPFSERELSIRLERRPVLRATGQTEWITMTAWHWCMLDWVIGGCVQNRIDFFKHAENYLKPSGFAVTLEWLLEGEYDLYVEQQSEKSEEASENESVEEA